MRIQANPLTQLVTAIFRRGGSEKDEAELVASSLVKSNLMGHDSHGVGLVPTYINHLKSDLLKPNTSVECARDDGAILMFDGQRGFGRRVGGEAMATAIDRCRETGVVLLTLRNSHHLGRIGAYGELAMDAGLISLHFVNVTDHDPSVAPWGGAEPRFVTNPVCIAMPGTETMPPTLLDMATSRIALGKVRVAMTKGEQLPEGIILDQQGEPSTDPNVMYADPRGALLPFGDHKGSGLALMCELLAGALSGGGTIHPGNPRQASVINNMFAIVVDPARLVETQWLNAEIDATLAYVKSARPIDPTHPVLVAGEPERARIKERTEHGIEVDDTAWGQILESAEDIGMTEAELEALMS